MIAQETMENLGSFLKRNSIFLLALLLVFYGALRIILLPRETRFVTADNFVAYAHWEAAERQIGRWGLDRDLARMQTDSLGQLPFRISLRLNRRMHEGDWFAARASIPFDARMVCFRFFADAYLDADEPKYFPSVEVSATVNGTVRSWPIYELGHDRLINFEAIDNPEGEVEIEFRLTALATDTESHLGRTTMHFEYMNLEECSQ